MFRRILTILLATVACATLLVFAYQLTTKDLENLDLRYEALFAHTESTITAMHAQDLEKTITSLESQIEAAKGDSQKQSDLIAQLSATQAELNAKNKQLVQENAALSSTATTEALQPKPTPRVITNIQYVEVAPQPQAELVRYNPATTPEDCGTGCVYAEVQNGSDSDVSYDGLPLTLVAVTVVDGGPFYTYITATMNSMGSIRWANVPTDAVLYITHPLTGVTIPVKANTKAEVHGEEIHASKGDIVDDGFKTKEGYEPIILITSW